MNAPTKLPTRKPNDLVPHRFANLFPMLDISSVGNKALVADIEARGQQEPVWLFEGQILEGKHRVRACSLIGREVMVREYTGDDPIGFVLSANLHRRHLDASQRAMIGGHLTELEVGDNQHTKEGTSIEVAAKLLNVGRASIERARMVLKHGDPNLIAQVEQGEVTVGAAAEEVKKKKTRKKKVATGGNNEGETAKEKAKKAYHALQERLVDALKPLGEFSFDLAEASVEKTKERLATTLEAMKQPEEGEEED